MNLDKDKLIRVIYNDLREKQEYPYNNNRYMVGFEWLYKNKMMESLDLTIFAQDIVRIENDYDIKLIDEMRRVYQEDINSINELNSRKRIAMILMSKVQGWKIE